MNDNLINCKVPKKELPKDISENLRDMALQFEENNLQPNAAFSREYQSAYQEDDDYRLPYKRDVERIIHSKAFARYIDKTQVVYLVENDHISNRGLHVQLVSNFSRGIANMLKLNIDLVEAIALGHDVGHPPFGHEGEEYLSDLSKEFGNKPYTHSLQSCRLFSTIEPLNLGLSVYDGFLCHDGGMSNRKLMPKFGKTWQDHLAECEKKVKGPDVDLLPGTLEGCLVKICDTMSYIGRDIEDAISIGILNRNQVPNTPLGNTNREILAALAKDIIGHSFGQQYICLSEESFEALQVLRRFNFEYIYSHPTLKRESAKIQKSYRCIFETLLEGFEKERESSYLWKNFVSNKSEQYKQETSPMQMVTDYISGMTDTHFVRTLENLLVPHRIELF